MEQFDVNALTASKELKDKGFFVKGLYEGTLHTWEQDTPFTVNEVKVALWYNALQHLGNLELIADDIVIHKWGFPIDEDLDSFQEKVCLLKCTLRSPDDDFGDESYIVEEDPIPSDPENQIDLNKVKLLDVVDSITFGEESPAFQITVKIDKVKAVVDVRASTTIGEMKEWIENEAGVKKEIYYLVYVDGKKKHKLEDHYTMEDYGITEDKEFQFAPKLGGTGKRGKAGDDDGLATMRNNFGRIMKMIEGNRTSQAANMTFYSMTVLTALLARYKGASVHEVLKTLSIAQLGELQTSIAKSTISTRYRAIAKVLFPDNFEAIEIAKQQLMDSDKVMIDGATLLMNMQYGVTGSMSWEVLVADVTAAITAKAVNAGAAAAGAAAPGAAAQGVDLLG